MTKPAIPEPDRHQWLARYMCECHDAGTEPDPELRREFEAGLGPRQMPVPEGPVPYTGD